jgi:hypothetical protein
MNVFLEQKCTHVCRLAIWTPLNMYRVRQKQGDVIFTHLTTLSAKKAKLKVERYSRFDFYNEFHR